MYVSIELHVLAGKMLLLLYIYLFSYELKWKDKYPWDSTVTFVKTMP
jgi:hypothetical protein